MPALADRAQVVGATAASQQQRRWVALAGRLQAGKLLGQAAVQLCQLYGGVDLQLGLQVVTVGQLASSHCLERLAELIQVGCPDCKSGRQLVAAVAHQQPADLRPAPG